MPWIGTPVGQGRRPVPFHPRDIWSLGCAVGCVGWQAGGAGKYTLNWPLLPLCTRQQKSGSFPAPEGGWTGLGRQQHHPHLPVASPALVSSSVSSSAASISNYKAFLMHRIIEVGAKPTQSWSCREEKIMAIMEGHNQYYCHKISVVTALAIFPNGLA